jgi:predicted transcriptional regulator
MKNFHLPLPDQVYDELKTEAQRSQIPATSMARQAIQTWLVARRKAARKQAIAAYAAANAGTELDLDRILENATVEFLLEGDHQ